MHKCSTGKYMYTLITSVAEPDKSKIVSSFIKKIGYRYSNKNIKKCSVFSGLRRAYEKMKNLIFKI